MNLLTKGLGQLGRLGGIAARVGSGGALTKLLAGTAKSGKRVGEIWRRHPGAAASLLGGLAAAGSGVKSWVDGEDGVSALKKALIRGASGAVVGGGFPIAISKGGVLGAKLGKAYARKTLDLLNAPGMKEELAALGNKKGIGGRLITEAMGIINNTSPRTIVNTVGKAGITAGSTAGLLLANKLLNPINKGLDKLQDKWLNKD